MKSELIFADALQRVLHQLPDDLAKNALAAVSRAGAKELQRRAYVELALDMQSRTPREDDVIIRKGKSTKGAVESISFVGPPKWKPELRWLHTGTKEHEIERNSSVYTHPGQPGRPWLLQAVWASNSAVKEAMAIKLRKAIDRQTKRLVSKEYRGRQLRGIGRSARRFL